MGLSPTPVLCGLEFEANKPVLSAGLRDCKPNTLVKTIRCWFSSFKLGPSRPWLADKAVAPEGFPCGATRRNPMFPGILPAGKDRGRRMRLRGTAVEIWYYDAHTLSEETP